MLNDLVKSKTWLAWDGVTAAATITVDADEPLDLNEQPVWPERERRRSALYVRRIVVARNYAGCGLGAALLDWAADIAQREYGAALIRIDVWTTNVALHNYYEGQRFTGRLGRNPAELAGYPSQTLFQREADMPGSDYKKLLTEEERNNQREVSLTGLPPASP